MSNRTVTIIYDCELCGRQEAVIRDRGRWRVGLLSAYCSACNYKLTGKRPKGQPRKETITTVWTEERKRKLEQLWRSRYPTDVIASRLGVSPNAVNIMRYKMKLPKQRDLDKKRLAT